MLNLHILGDIYFNSLTCKENINLVENIFPYISKSDLRIANLESPILKNKKVYNPILKTGPNLKSDQSCCEFLKNLNINMVTLANNHIGDYGEDGIRDTIDFLEKYNIMHVGAGNNIEEAYKSLHFIKNNISVSIISVCENEFGIATKTNAGAAGFIPEKMQQIIFREKKQYDHIIVIFHGGHEYNPLPSPKMIQRYHYIIDAGASAVIGMHTHCPQGYEYYKNGIIAYSLGNFFFSGFNPKDPYSTWYIGYIANLKLTSSDIKLNVIPYRYSIFDNKIYPLTDININIFTNYINKLNKIINDKSELENYFETWCLYIKEKYLMHLKWDNNLTDLTKLKLSLEIQNLFRCESHRELMQKYFELLSKEKENILNVYYLRQLQYFGHIPINIDNAVEEISLLNINVLILNEEEIIKLTLNKEVYICGAGNVAINLYCILLQNNVCVKLFLDNNQKKVGNYLFSVKIESFDSLKNKNISDGIFIIAVFDSFAQNSICKQLLELKISSDHILKTIIKEG